jgi:hypothetical protein
MSLFSRLIISSDLETAMQLIKGGFLVCAWKPPGILTFSFFQI